MKLKDVQLSRPTQYWVKRSDRKPQIKAGLHSELRDWVQYVIMEAEKNKDFKKKAQFLSLLDRSEHNRGLRGFVIWLFQRF